MSWFSLSVLLLLSFTSVAMGQFTCQPYDSSVARCNPYIANSTSVAVPTGLTIAMIGATLNTKLDQISTAGPSCKAAATELICKSGFQACGPLPSRPCNSICTTMIQFCWETFQIAGAAALLPNCSSVDGAGLETYPVTGTFYNPPGLTVPCTAGILNTPTNPLTPSFYCDTFAAPTNPQQAAATKNTYELCSKYFPSTSNQIFITDQFSQFQIAAGAVEPKLAQLVASQALGLPSSCFSATVELICKTAFNPCTRLPAGAIGNPVAVFAPSPPCKSLCDISTNQCAEAFLLSSNLANLPNCLAPSAFPGQPQYPTTAWTFTINGATLPLPCNPPVNPSPPATFRCEAFNANLTATCAKYITYDVLIPPPFYSQAAISAFIAPNLASTTALPSACKSHAEELICTSAFQPCSQTPLTLSSPPAPVATAMTFYMGQPPCQSMCTTMQKQCAQVFSLVGQSASIPNCASISSSTGQKTYPDTGLTFPFATIPCRPSQLTSAPAPFSCEPFKGSPKECKPFVDYNFMVTPEFSQSFIAKAVATNLDGTEALPDAARIPLQEFICHSGFQRCGSQVVNNITFNWGRPPCHSSCTKAVEQIQNIFTLTGNSAKLPNCDAISTTNGQPSNPKTELTFSAFGTTMKVLCNPPDEANKYKERPVRCEKYGGKMKFCKDYINSKSVFVNDLLPFDTTDTVLQQLYDLYLEAPEDCRNYIHRIGCSVLLPECEEEGKGLPEKFAFPKPPCSSVCSDIPSSCKDFWDKTGLPKPDCKERDSLTTQSRYPKEEWKFEYINTKTKITSKCVTPKDDNKNDNDN